MPKNLENAQNIVIVCSTLDPASQNIKEKLLDIRPWKKSGCSCSCSLGCSCNVYEFNQFRIVEVDAVHLELEEIDRHLKTDCGFVCDVLIFVSRHKAKNAKPVLTAHFTGNVDEAKLGGNIGELACAAPYTLRSILRSMNMLAVNEPFDITMESTHHGPTNIRTPSVYVEIGSTETEWVNDTAGRIVANAILAVEGSDVPVAVGFGGNHYAPRQTNMLFEAGIAFGHNFPDYTLDKLDKDIIAQAFEKSDADFAYFDRKSMSAKDRDRLEKIINELGYEVLRESDIREMDGVPWSFCTQIRNKTRELCPAGRARLTDGIKCEVASKKCEGCICPKVKVARIDRELLEEAQKFDMGRIKNVLDRHNIAYVEHKNGTVAHTIIGIGDDCARFVAEELANECIKILKEHYTLQYDTNESKLYLSEQKFSPKLANNLGVKKGPAYGMLASGKSVVVDGKTIEPAMVYETIKRTITLKNVKAKILEENLL